MNNKALWIGLAVSACGLVLVSRAKADERNREPGLPLDVPPQPDDSLRPVAAGGGGQAQVPAGQLPTAASASPLVVLLGSGLVAVTIGLAAIRKYAASPSSA